MIPSMRNFSSISLMYPSLYRSERTMNSSRYAFAMLRIGSIPLKDGKIQLLQ